MRISLRELLLVVAVAAVGLAGLKFASSGMLPIVQAMTGLVLFAFAVRALVDRGPRQAFAIGFLLCGLAYLLVIMMSQRAIYLTGGTAGPSYVEVNSPAGTFGTQSVLDSLYNVVVVNDWVNLSTGKPDVTFQPTETEKYQSQVIRLELKALPPETGKQDKAGAAEAVADTSAATGTGSTGTGTTGTGTTTGTPPQPVPGGGRGRRGRGRGGGMASALSPEQYDEFIAASSNRQSELGEIFQRPEGQAAILSGRPLSTMKQVTFSQRFRPGKQAFETAGYCLWTLIVGYAGGLFARFVYTRRAGRQATT